MADRALPDLVADTLRKAAETPDGSAELRRFNHVFQFVVTDGMPFILAIRDGTVTVTPGEAPPLPYEEMETIRADTATLRSLVEGHTRLIDLGWEGQLLIPLYGPKMHLTAWLNRLLKAAHGVPVKIRA